MPWRSIGSRERGSCGSSPSRQTGRRSSSRTTCRTPPLVIPATGSMNWRPPSAPIATIWWRPRPRPASPHGSAGRSVARQTWRDQCDRLLHAAVGVFLDAVARTLHIADRYSKEELAAGRLLLQGFERALTEQRQLHLAHRAFHAEEQAVVWMLWIIDAILVDDKCADQAAE